MTGEPPSLSVQLASTALALVFVLALAWLALRALRRLQQPRGSADPAGAPQLLHSLALSPRERLLCVRWRGRDYLLGQGPGGIHCIDQRAPEQGGG